MDAKELKDFEKKSIRANNFLHRHILNFGETSEWDNQYKKSVAKIIVADCRRLVGDLSDEINKEYLEIPRAFEIKDSLQLELNLLEKTALPYVN